MLPLVHVYARVRKLKCVIPTHITSHTSCNRPLTSCTPLSPIAPSASEEAEQAILEALAVAGIEPAKTNRLRVPSRYRATDAVFRSADAHLGLGHYDDMFELLIRFVRPRLLTAATTFAAHPYPHPILTTTPTPNPCPRPSRMTTSRSQSTWPIHR